MELSLPSPECRIIIVSFLLDNNKWSCGLHPFGCGNIVVLHCDGGGVGMLVRLRMLVPDELACIAVNPDRLMVVMLLLLLGSTWLVEMGEGLMVRLSVL